MLDTETQNYLYTLRRRGIKVGLHRTQALLEKCAIPYKSIPVIHIAGTNGKGSTAAMIASVLQKANRKVGLYTSPHLVYFNERIRVNGIPIEDEQINHFLNRFRKHIDTLGSTFFETTTALTFHTFAEKQVDVAVMEVGMGGRLDSSNVANSIISILTPIDIDHVEFLGYDLVSITREKCGILRSKSPAIIAPQQDEVYTTIKKSIAALSTPFYCTSEALPVDFINISPEGSQFTADGIEFEIPLMGRHQVINAQTAIVACQIFDDTIDTGTIKEGLRTVRWPGRLQKMSVDPLVYYDVAHNSSGVTAVLETLQELFKNRSIGAICAFKKTKQMETIGQLLSQSCRFVITTEPGHGEFFSPQSLAKQLSRSGVTATPIPSPSQALDTCFDRSGNCDLWLIFGTHYLAEPVFKRFYFPFDKDKI